MKKSITVWITLLAGAVLGAPSNRLIRAIEQVESGGDTQAIGDGGSAVGCLQIHPEVVTEVNRINNQFTLEDRYSRVKSYAMARIYLNCWGEFYKHRSGEKPTDEIYARIWNGGPRGYLNPNTKRYWEKVKKEMNK